MRDRVETRMCLPRASALAALAWFLAAAASAQPYEDVFGPAGAFDQGARRVTPVSACADAANGGFVAVGTTTRPGTPSDVLVVRTDATGATVWERTYDIALGRADQGLALAEARDGSGYVVTGLSSGPPTGVDVLLMKVDCNGEPLWANTYLGPGPGSEGGFDVVEARTGTPGLGTQAGDILVAGITVNPVNNTRDSLLLRTNAAGGLIWNQRYNIGVAHEMFRALTEARTTAGSAGTGDVVAVGQFVYGTLVQGYAVRVDGDTGLIGAAPQGAVMYGGPDREGFESVVELRTPPLTGNLVMVGSTRSAANASDIWAVRTAPAPATVLVQRRIGAAATDPLGEEIALDVNEVTNPLPTFPVGRLALTGHAGAPGTLADDAFLLVLGQGALVPAPGGAQLFGDHAGRRDWGVSLDDHPRGFIIAGFSESNLEGAAPADARDLYLVNTDPAGQTSCSRDWRVPHQLTQFPANLIPQVPTRFLLPRAQHVTSERRDTRIRVCP